MELLVSLYPYDRWSSVDEMVEAAVLADRLGIHGLSFADHVVAPIHEDRPAIGDCWYDNITLASHLAALTERIRFYFYALIVPYRNPVILAKQIATLDTLSHGRTTLTVAAGWYEEEFEALGVPFENRGERLDEYIQAMKTLWTEPNPEYKGAYVSFSNLAFLPKCAQEPHVPMLIGGSGPRPLRRVVAEGDGWAPMLGTPEEIKESVAWIGEHSEATEPLPVMFSLQVGDGDDFVKGAFKHAGGEEAPSSEESVNKTRAAIEALRTYAEAGVTHMLVVFGWETAGHYKEALRWLAEEVVPEAASL